MIDHKGKEMQPLKSLDRYRGLKLSGEVICRYPLRVSWHARRRWARHFPGRDLMVELGLAVVPSRRVAQLIRKQAPIAGTKTSRYHLLTPTAIVFVVSILDYTIVTAFPFNRPHMVDFENGNARRNGVSETPSHHLAIGG